MQPKNIPWRVRVRKVVEEWEEVHAPDPDSAIAAAMARQGVSDYMGMVLRADKIVGQQQVGVEDEDSEHEH